jgi:hypothetical protein
VVHGKIKAEFIQCLGCHTWFDEWHEKIKRLGGELASFAHASKGVWAMQLDLACFAAVCGICVNKIHLNIQAQGAVIAKALWHALFAFGGRNRHCF